VWRDSRPTGRGPLGGGKVRSYEVDQMLGRMLRQAVWERLDMLDELATSADNGSLLSAVRSELPRLTHAWRALLASHAPDPRGRCLECSSHWRSRGISCSVWRAAHEHLAPAEMLMASPKAELAESGETSVRARFRAFSRLRASRSSWHTRQRTSLFPAAVATGTPAVH
jgi:hypothetical protein